MTSDQDTNQAILRGTGILALRDVCDDFEASLQAGRRPLLEAYVSRVPRNERRPLLYGLAEREIADRRARGERPMLDEYRRRFPEHEALLAALFLDVAVARSLLGSLGYRMIRGLGTGRSGEVYQVCRQDSGHHEAVTIIPAGFVKETLAQAPHPAELRRLVHAHIAHPSRAVHHRGHLLLFSDYVCGWTFRQLVERCGPLPIGAACELVRQAALGLDYLHSHGRTHGTVAPTNLILGSQGGDAGVVKVTSVGLNDFADLHLARYVLPMPGRTAPDWRGFLAPEYLTGLHDSDPPGDIYSLGCILVYLLLARLPRRLTLRAEIDLLTEYLGEDSRLSTGDSVAFVASTLSELHHDLPRGLEAAAEQMLAWQPEMRFASAVEVAQALLPFAEPQMMDDLLATMRADRPQPSCLPAVAAETLLERFESDWREGHVPDIEDYSTAAQDWADTERRALLVELIAIELECRWRGSAATDVSDAHVASRERTMPLRLEAYFERFPELAAGSEEALELAAEEYRVRHRWGDCPDTAEYLTRFPALAERLPSRLKEIERESVGETDIQQDADATDPSPAGEPETIGRYRVVRVLGSGTFGTVSLAQDDELGRLVAVKVPHCHPATSSAGEDFRREAQLLASLDHAGIIPVYDVGRTEEGRLYIVSKYVEGSNLRERIKEGLPSPAETAGIISAVAEALHHAHNLGVLHRDVKPENVLLNSSSRPLLADFGLALHENEQPDHRNEVSGTPAYMAPEQVRGKTHHLDGRADVWSLGVILYELLTGRRPFRGRTREELFDEILHRDPKPPRMIDGSIPSELERITLKCLQKGVADRYPTAADLSSDLGTWIASDTERPPDAPQSPEPEPTALRRPFRRIPRSIAVGVLVVGMLVVVMLLTWMWTPPAPPPEWSATLVELPSPAAGWWFDEMPWYTPAVRAAVSTRLEQDWQPLAEAFERSPTKEEMSQLMSQMWLFVDKEVIPWLEKNDPPEAATAGALRRISDGDFTTQERKVAFQSLLDDKRMRDPGRATAFHLRALLRHETGDLQGAGDDYDEALRLYSQAKDNSLYALCATDSARVYIGTARADSNAALDRLNRAAGSARSVLLQIDVTCLQAEAYVRWRNQYERARKKREKAEELADKLRTDQPHAYRARLHEVQAWAALLEWRLTAAREHFENAYKFRHQLPIGFHRNLEQIMRARQGQAMAHHFLGQPDQAQEIYERLLEDIESALESRTLYGEPLQRRQLDTLTALRPNLYERLADTWLFGPEYDYRKARDSFKKALDAADDPAFKLDEKWPHIEALRYKYAVALTSLGETELARREFQRAEAEVKRRHEECVQELGDEDAREIAERQRERIYGLNQAAARALLDLQMDSLSAQDKAAAVDKLKGELREHLATIDRRTLDMTLFALESVVRFDYRLPSELREELRLWFVKQIATVVVQASPANSTEREGATPYLARYFEMARREGDALIAETEDQEVQAELAESQKQIERGLGQDPPPWGNPPTRPRKLHILNIGISKYQRLPDLPGAVKDAEALNQAFQSLIAREDNLFEHGESSVLTDKAATDDVAKVHIIHSLLSKLGAQSVEGDLIIITISGHGVEQDGLYCLLGYDFDPDKPYSGLSILDLQHRLARLKANVLLILDTCDSGHAANIGALPSGSRDNWDNWVIVLSASRAAALEGHLFGGHGALSLAILEFLQREYLHEGPWPEDNSSPRLSLKRSDTAHTYTVDDLYDYVKVRVPQITNNGQHPALRILSGNPDYHEIPLFRDPESSLRH